MSKKIAFITSALVISIFFGKQQTSLYAQEKTDWLGIAISWENIEQNPEETNLLFQSLGTPWMYDWKHEQDRLSVFGTRYTPMMWGCSANDIEPIINWPQDDYYVLFLNEPEIPDQANCSPEVASDLLHTLLTHPNKKPGMKVLIGGSANGTTWTNSLLTIYQNSYGSLPPIAGIHIHIYPDAPNNATADSLFQSAQQQLNLWTTFAQQHQQFMQGKQVWITETGVLNPNINPAVIAEFMNLWIPYLDSQPLINRVYWFIANTSTGNYAYPWRNTAVYNDYDQTALTTTFITLCQQYCPSPIVVPADTPVPTATPVPTDTVQPPSPTPTCEQLKLTGDYTCDGTVNEQDLNAWRTDYQTSPASTPLVYFEYIRLSLYQ